MELNAMVMRFVLLGKNLFYMFPSCDYIQTKSVLDTLNKFLEVDFSIFVFIKIIELY